MLRGWRRGCLRREYLEKEQAAVGSGRGFAASGNWGGRGTLSWGSSNRRNPMLMSPMFQSLAPVLTRTALYLGGVGLCVGVALAAAPDPRAEEALSLTETYCDARNVVAATLRHDFDEAPRLVQVTAEGMKMELWASELMGTWTVVHHGSDGISYIVTSGQDWSGATDAAVVMDAALGEAVWGS